MISSIQLQTFYFKENCPSSVRLCVQHKLDIVGDYILTWASSLHYICKESGVNLSYFACHEKVNCCYSLESLNRLSFKTVSTERVWLPMFF